MKIQGRNGSEVFFDAQSTEDRILILRDLGGPLSLTNGVESVLEYLRADIGIHINPPRAIVYRDTDGMYDEILIDRDRGTFSGFRSLGAITEADALYLIRSR
jgi:hypothetical protein